MIREGDGQVKENILFDSEARSSLSDVLKERGH